MKNRLDLEMQGSKPGNYISIMFALHLDINVSGQTFNNYGM